MAERFKAEVTPAVPLTIYVAAALTAYENTHYAFLLYHRLLVEAALDSDYQTNDQLATKLSTSKRTVQRAMAQLQTLELVTVLPVSATKRRFVVATELTPKLRTTLAKVAKGVLVLDTKTGELVEGVTPRSQRGDTTDPAPGKRGDTTDPHFGTSCHPVTPQTLTNQLNFEGLTGGPASTSDSEPQVVSPKEAESADIYSTNTMSLKENSTSTSTSLSAPKSRKRDWRGTEAYPVFVHLFGLWKELSPYAVNWKEDESRFKYVQARLKDGFTADDLETVLRVAAKQPMYDFGNRRVVVDFKHIFTNRVKVEQMLAESATTASRPSGKGRVATDAFNPALGASKAKYEGSEF